MITLPNDSDAVFAHIPARLGVAYLESVLSRCTGRDVGIADCIVTNLCSEKWGGVSNSGATVILAAQRPIRSSAGTNPPHESAP